MIKIIAFVLASIAVSTHVQVLAANTAEHSHTKHHHTAKLALELNNGSKWEMDEHTRNMSKKMKQTFLTAEHANLESLNNLGKQLQSQLDVLIRGCTMTGEAHDQLHVFLSTHMPAIHALESASDYASAKKHAIELKHQFEVYGEYFE